MLPAPEIVSVPALMVILPLKVLVTLLTVMVNTWLATKLELVPWMKPISVVPFQTVSIAVPLNSSSKVSFQELSIGTAISLSPKDMVSVEHAAAMAGRCLAQIFPHRGFRPGPWPQAKVPRCTSRGIEG